MSKDLGILRIISFRMISVDEGFKLRHFRCLFIFNKFLFHQLF